MAHNTKVSCNYCGAPILWMKTKTGKSMPVDYKKELDLDNYWDPTKMVSHFSTCTKYKKGAK